jgi:hypothetical protein
MRHVETEIERPPSLVFYPRPPPFTPEVIFFVLGIVRLAADPGYAPKQLNNVFVDRAIL